MRPTAKRKTTRSRASLAAGPPQVDLAVVGLGRVGLTVAAAFAARGLRVLGIEKRPEVVALLRRAKSRVLEPGIDAVLRRTLGRRLHVTAEWPERLPEVVVVCVSTPANPETRTPDLRNITDTADELARRLPPDGLVIVRSAVPVGTSRKLVLERIRRVRPRAGLACCPERAARGSALRALRARPQLLGAIDDASAERAAALFRRLTRRIVRVPNPETAELVRLIDSCRTDLRYAFGNEVALLARTHGLDPLEVIRGANEGDGARPREVAAVQSRIAVPGYVGGRLSKDPYLLLPSLGERPPEKSLVFAVRELNESMPLRAAADVLRLLRGAGKDPARSRVLVCGFACRGGPGADDLRGAPAGPFVQALHGRVGRLLGHDYDVAAAELAGCGVEPVRLVAGLERADAVVLLCDHPRYARDLTPRRLATTRAPVVVYDSWRVLRDTAIPALPQVRYAGLGHEG
ncbi:MAG: nucleotide sugar dehydrogenase [Deltaproteobacteria bacterium]|nr:nucleotide sugar dehydrogenase [Deltaproteobacteria bacterium]